MSWSDYWGALTSRQRAVLLIGALLISAAAVGTAAWLLHDPYVTLSSGLTNERLNELTRELERAKINYRVGENADAVIVPQSQLGKARAAAAAGGDFGIPPSVGLELFKDTDFSTTDFAQRINYQRALQGELTRTIQTISGVRSARVHVILADNGLFKRDAARASAAVSVALQPGKVLSPPQVRGIQRLVAASVPEIRIDDVVVLDEFGTSLTRIASSGEGDLSSAQLDLKRQADQYLESKVLHLLQDLVPQGVASLSVDTVLDDRQLRVTTDEPLAVRTSKEGEHATGVLVKERQSQHGRVAAPQNEGDVVEGDSTDWEHEYTVGHRTEQTLSSPGSIKRVSVAVALRGAPPELTTAAVEQLVGNAVGINPARGDTVAVVLLPGLPVAAAADSTASIASGPPAASGDVSARAGARSAQAATAAGDSNQSHLLEVALAVTLFGAVLGAAWWGRVQARAAERRARVEVAARAAGVDGVTAQIRQWLNEGATGGRF